MDYKAICTLTMSVMSLAQLTPMLNYLLLAVLTVTSHVLAALILNINVLTVLLPTSEFMVQTNVLKLAVMDNLLTL